MNGRLSLVRVFCYQVEISATGRSVVQRNPTVSGLSERDREASIMRRSWPARGQVRHGEKNTQCNSSHSRLLTLNVSQQSYPSSLAITHYAFSHLHICSHLALACHSARSVPQVRGRRLLRGRFTYCYYAQGQRIWISGENGTFRKAVTRKYQSS